MKKVIIFLFVVFVIKTMAQAADVNKNDPNLTHAIGSNQANVSLVGFDNCPEGTCTAFTNQVDRFADTTNYTKAEGKSTEGSGINK